MTASILLRRAGPLTTIQEDGRFGMLRHGIGASGPMDRGGYMLAGALAGGGRGAIEFTRAGLDIEVTAGRCIVGFGGGGFTVQRDGTRLDWPGSVRLDTGDRLAIMPGQWGNYGYLRFDGDIDVPEVMGSLSTSSRVRLGGLEGRGLIAGDVLRIGDGAGRTAPMSRRPPTEAHGPIRIVWGLHADAFAAAVRAKFLTTGFVVSTAMDRMGVRLDDPSGVFAGATILSLVSDAIVPGDIQILGDGTPIVLMRDHQPTGGYPRIATVISADFDRFSQLRPGSAVAFEPVTVEHAHRLLRSA